MSDTTLQKRCSRCRDTKPADQFRRDRSNKDGLTGWCKTCWKDFRASLDYDVDPTLCEKCCSRCKSVKPVDQFGAYRKNKDGLCSWCRTCSSDHNRDRSLTLNYVVDPEMREKLCGKCKNTKPVDQFDRNRRRKDGLQNRCRACLKEINRDWYAQNKDRAAELARAWAADNPDLVKAAGRKGHLKKMYGLTLEDYDQLLEAQGGECVCGAVEDPLHVDHDHGTGEVRGLLCGSCNRTLGMASDSPERLLALVEYLRHPPARQLRLAAHQMIEMGSELCV